MRHVELDHKAKIAWVKNGNIAIASFAFEAWGGANKAQMAAEKYLSEGEENPWELRDEIRRLSGGRHMTHPQRAAIVAFVAAQIARMAERMKDDRSA